MKVTRNESKADAMSIEIEVLNGDTSWARTEPLLDAVWPEEVVEKLPWGLVEWAHASRRPKAALPATSAFISGP
jgi:hypothetical protein